MTLPLSSLTQILPFVIKSKLSLIFYQFAFLVFNQLKSSSVKTSTTQPSSSTSTIPKLMDLKIFPTHRYLLNPSFLQITQLYHRQFPSKSNKVTNPTTPATICLTLPTSPSLSSSLIGDVFALCYCLQRLPLQHFLKTLQNPFQSLPPGNPPSVSICSSPSHPTFPSASIFSSPSHDVDVQCLSP